MSYDEHNECPVIINFSNMDYKYEFLCDSKNDYEFLIDKYNIIVRNYVYYIIYFSSKDIINVYSRYNIETYYNIIIGNE